MLPEVPVTIAVTSEHVEFRFPGALSMFMLVVRRDEEVLWELMANEGQRVEAVEDSVSFTPLEEATPELLEMVRRAEENFMRRARENPPLTSPVSRVRYGEVPPGYREEAAAPKLVPGRYDFAAMFAQGQASGEFDVPAANLET